MKNFNSYLKAIVFCLISPALFAVDGVLEISQTCAVQLGCFSGDAPGYPVAIDGSAGASYRLTSDLIVPDLNTHGISIVATDISIDLNGFSVVGLACVGATSNCTPGSGTGYGVTTSSTSFGVIVSNGSVVGMGGYGVYLIGAESRVSDLRARWNRFDGIRTDGAGAIVNDSIAFENGINGIRTLGPAVLSGNVVSSNGSNGISGGAGSNIYGSLAYLNQANGLTAGFGATFRDNSSYLNSFNGISANIGSTVSGNTVWSNGANGISGQAGCSIRGNTVRGNAGIGLTLNANAAFLENVISDNGNGTISDQVVSGFNMGNNFCNTGLCP